MANPGPFPANLTNNIMKPVRFSNPAQLRRFPTERGPAIQVYNRGAVETAEFRINISDADFDQTVKDWLAAAADGSWFSGFSVDGRAPTRARLSRPVVVNRTTSNLIRWEMDVSIEFLTGIRIPVGEASGIQIPLQTGIRIPRLQKAEFWE